MTKLFDFDNKENYGIQICTSSTRPTAYLGRHIFETDTKKTMKCTNVTGPVWEEINTGITWDEQSFTNLLKNGNFESWSDGASSAPDGWLYAGAGGSVAREATIVKYNTYSAKITRITNDAVIYQDVVDITQLKDNAIIIGVWVYATVADRARITVDDDVQAAQASSYHTGDSTWQYLEVSYNVDSTATYLRVHCYVDSGDTSAYFDGIIEVKGSVCPAFSPKPLVDDGKSIQINSTTNAVTIGRDPTADAEVATKKYVDDNAGVGNFKADGSVPMTGNLQMGDNDITGANAVQATASQDLTLKVSTGQSIIFQAV